MDVPDLTVELLDQLAAGPFVGISMYTGSTMSDGRLASAVLSEVSTEVWAWLVDHCWLVSCNDSCVSRSGPDSGWGAWLEIIGAHPELRLIVAHLGLPIAAPPSKPGVAPWTTAECQERIADVLALAAYPGPRVKLSGFYALTTPGHDYPHVAAWGYVESLLR